MSDLMERGGDGEPAEESDSRQQDEEEGADRGRLWNPVRLEPLDAGSDRCCKGEREEKEDDDASHLPDAEGGRGDGDRTRSSSRSGSGKAAGGNRRCLFVDVRSHTHDAGAGRPSCGATRPTVV